MPLQVQFDKDESFELAKVVEVDKPSIKQDNQVLAKFLLISISSSHVLIISGLYPAFRHVSYPAAPGLEGATQVVKVGKSAKPIKIGQRAVISPAKFQNGVTKEGTWTEYGDYSEENLFVVPNNISNETSAQAFISPVTACWFLDKTNAPKEEYIIQTATASALGSIFIQFAKSRGIKTINLVRCDKHVEELKAIGADEVFNTESGTDLIQEVKRITDGKGPYGTVDGIRGKIGLMLTHSVRDDGLILLYSGLGGLEVNVSTVELTFRNIHYTGFYLTKYIIGLQ